MKYFLSAIVMVVLFQPSMFGQWSNATSPFYRHYNSIGILSDQTAVLAGGNRTNDSIQTLLASTTTGNNWYIAYDRISPWFKGVAFTSPVNVIAVGYYGTIRRTATVGASWDTIAPPAQVAARHFNAICFADAATGYIVGGKQANDSIQTILKTTDGGGSWSVQRDLQGYWLNAVFFIDANTGFAVGDRGVILKTVNGGTNWSALPLTGNIASRSYNSVCFLDANTGFVVGGNLSNDSIQTILKTTDGGNNWNVIMDRPGYMLNAVTFATGGKTYAVGNFGVVYNSIDTGATWTPAPVPSGDILDTMDLNDVKFSNADFGLICGRYGKIIKYASPVPTVPLVETFQASNVGYSTGKLKLSVNPRGFTTSLSFEYGTTPAFGSTANLPNTVSGTSTLLDTITLNGLLPNTFYYCRAKAVNQNGTSYGGTIQFYTVDCEVPNCDFEIWDTFVRNRPLLWNIVGPVFKVPSYNGGAFAAQLGPEAGAILLGIPNEGIPAGGIPFPARPDSVKFKAKYDIVAGDSAFVIIVFKKNGLPLTPILIPIAGNSGGNFVPLSFPIVYTDTITPDTLVFGITSSNLFDDGGTPASVITVDDISFTGTNIVLPNWNLEQWDTVVVTRPRGWYSDSYGGEAILPIIKSDTACVTGHLALRIESQVGSSRRIEVGETRNNNGPTFAVGGLHLTLNLFAKYLQQGNDTLYIALTMFNGDSSVGYGQVVIDTPLAEYTPIIIDITYGGNTTVPDSAGINITIGSQMSPGGSMAYIDNISFDGFRIPTGIKTVAQSQADFAIYPNPGSTRVTIEVPQFNGGDLQLLSLTGTLVHAERIISGKKEIDVSGLPDGLYVIKLSTSDKVMMKKLVIAR